MRRLGSLALFLLASIGSVALSAPPQPPQHGEELQITAKEVGHYGGVLTVGQRSEPKTLNPTTAADAPSREVIGRLTADLIHINRASQLTEPALAKSWTVSQSGGGVTGDLRH